MSLLLQAGLHILYRVCYAAHWTCPKGYAQCYGSSQCLLTWFFNDGENDCNFGTDELEEYKGTITTNTCTIV